MDFEPEEQQIIDLLTKLKNQQNGVYPKNLLGSRRKIFLSQMASIGAGLGIGAGLKAATKSKLGSVLQLSNISASSLVETLLVVAIVAQASVIAYTYRDRIIDFVSSLSAPATPTALIMPATDTITPEATASDTPVVTETGTETATPVTPTGTVTSLSTAPASDSTPNNTAVASTPVPPTGNPGNHFGQTPKPTNDTGSGGGGGGTGNGNGTGTGTGKKP